MHQHFKSASDHNRPSRRHERRMLVIQESDFERTNTALKLSPNILPASQHLIVRPRRYGFESPILLVEQDRALLQLFSKETEKSMGVDKWKSHPQVLGIGGCGASFLVRTVSGQQVVAKVLRGNINKDYARDELKNAKIIHDLQLKDPKVCDATAKIKSVSYGIPGEQPAMVIFERMHMGIGEAIDAHMKANNKAQVYRLIADVVDAVNALQKHGLCHNDIKPDNIMIDQNGQAKLIDFGCITKSGEHIKGTSPLYYYMHPSLDLPREKAGKASEIYMLGRTIAALLTRQGDVPGKKYSALDAVRVEFEEDIHSDKANAYLYQTVAKRHGPEIGLLVSLMLESSSHKRAALDLQEISQRFRAYADKIASGAVLSPSSEAPAAEKSAPAWLPAASSLAQEETITVDWSQPRDRSRPRPT